MCHACSGATDRHPDRDRAERPGNLSRRAVLGGAVALGFGGGLRGGSRRVGAARRQDDRDAIAAATTLTRTAERGDARVPGLPYRRMVPGNGWPLVVREELAPAQDGRERTRRALAAFVHLTDLHVVDACSPGHAAFLRQYPGSFAGADFSNGFRSQDTLTAHVVDAMVRRVNAVARGPVSGRDFDFAISTGDNADSRATHEMQALVDVLSGGTRVTFNAAGGPYAGLQDDDPSVPDAIYDAFWHPNPASGSRGPDRWKREFGYPDLPGFLDAVVRPIDAPGLAMPWYGGFGNHDIVLMGVLPDGSSPARFLQRLATGDRLPIAVPEGMDVAAFLTVLAGATDEEIADLIDRMPTRQVPAASSRASFTRADFVRMHLDSPGRFGPDGHGFTQANIEQDTAWYRFEVAPGIVGFMLDSTNPNGGPDGSLDPAQVAWLAAELASVHSRHFDSAGNEVRTGNEDRLVVLFSHHNSRTFDNLATPPGETVSDRMGSQAFEAFLRRYPNVVLWVNGHTHANQVWAHPDPSGRTGGVWEVNTAAHIDYPQEARTIELFDNGDGTLSIVGVMIDHSDAGDIAYGPDWDPATLAAISLELAANDPALDFDFRLGTPADRNVELVVRKPF